MYETGTAIAVRAFHVMPGMPLPEGERHAHDYRLDVVARRDGLDERGMVIDLDALDGALREIAGTIDGGDLDQIVAPETGARAVTVEIFARWVHDRLTRLLAPMPGLTLAVRVWESPVAFGGYLAVLSDPASPD
ncbi:MAG TPA: 6-carboxytetrahydropterin synthase [Actinomycetes bacterium]|nr:6-carboxytetrahydropterin synthase [Actinomycetes bacterium]